MILPKDYIKKNGTKINRIGKNVCVFLPEESKEFYEKVIVKVVKKLACTSKSFLDLPVGNGLENIWKNLLEAGIIIVDISNYSPSVMFELGATLTHRDAQEVIIICDEKDRERSVPFNIGPLNINYYDQSDRKRIGTFEKKLESDMESILINYSIEDPIRNLEAIRYMEKAQVRMEKRDWLEAKLLFQEMDRIEPDNWKITKEWGRLYRLMGKSYQDAHSKLEVAQSLAKHPIHKSEVFLEFALLYDSNKETDKVERSLNQAEEWNSKDKKIYLAWIRFYMGNDEMPRAMEKAIVLHELDNKDKLANNWVEYLSMRMRDKSYNKSFEEFEKEAKITDDDLIGRKPARPIKIPHNISITEFQSKYVGKIVYGLIDNINERIGVFVILNREYTGLIKTGELPHGVLNRLRPKLKIVVRIEGTFVDSRTGKLKIWLKYM